MSRTIAESWILAASFLLLWNSAVLGQRPDSTGRPSIPRQKETTFGYIDTHVHLNGLRFPDGRAPGRGMMPPVRQGEPRPRSKPRGRPTKDYASAADNLIRQMDRYGVSKVLILPPPQVPGDMTKGIKPKCNDLLIAVRRYPDRLFLVGGGDVLNPYIYQYKPSEVTPAIKNRFEKDAKRLVQLGIKGFGEMSALHFSFNNAHVFMEESSDHPLFLLLADLSARYNLPIDLHMEAIPKDMPMPAGFDRVSNHNPARIKENLSSLERLLSHNRRAKIVWQHLGWDNTGNLTIDLVRRLLKKHSNLYFALRVEERLFTMGRTPMPNRIVDRQWKIRPEWIALFREFPERFVIGSDEFIGMPGETSRMPQSFDETWSIIEQLPPDLATKIGRDNAARVYNLDVSSPARASDDRGLSGSR